MDIAAAQWALGRIGRLDRLDVLLADRKGIEQVEQEIRAQLPAGISVQRPGRRGAQVEKMLEAFHFNLAALSYIALLVGLFLIYNTVSISVITRREEIGTLRAIGVTRGRILLLFLAEAAGMATIGCTLGLLLARLLSYGAVKLTATTVQSLYIATAASPEPLGMKQVLLAFGIGLPLALLAAALPALEAARVAPMAAMRGNDRLATRYRLRPALLIAPPALFIAGWWMARSAPGRRSSPLRIRGRDRNRLWRGAAHRWCSFCLAGLVTASCFDSSELKAAWPTPTWRARSRDFRSRSPLWPSACR
jgi:putative ABC transport system permease protein